MRTGCGAPVARPGHRCPGPAHPRPTRTYGPGLYAEDVHRVCGRAREPPRPGRHDLTGEPEAPAAEGVRSSHPGQEREALRGADPAVRRGGGGTGGWARGRGIHAGRAHLGPVHPGAGPITWNGVDGSDIRTGQVRARIGPVGRDRTRMPFTALRCITLGGPRRPGGTDEVVAALAKGLDTTLDRRFVGGADLSGGQRQRTEPAGARTRGRTR
ncbi:hypothetical protein SUDANB121_00114 [Nocardiopsis dassonvillei]